VPCSQKPTSDPYSEPNKSSTKTPTPLFNTYFNIIQSDFYFFKTEYLGNRMLPVHSSGMQPISTVRTRLEHYGMHAAIIKCKGE
jgi:hypothetical protein